MYWEKDIETLSKEQIKELQLERLKWTISQASKSPFYSKMFKECSVSPDKIKSLEDLQNLPYTTKKELRAGFPFQFLSVPVSEIIRVHTSSGTTGSITAVLFTPRDLDKWSDLVARCMYITGSRKEDIFQNTMGYGLFTGGLGLHYGAEKIGMTIIPSGPGNTKRQIKLIQNFGTTILHILPSYALRMRAVFDELQVVPQKDTKLKIAYIGAEPHTEAMRQRIEELFGIDAYNSYGLSEMNGPGVAFECPYKNGMHVWEDSYIMEVIDPKSLKVLPDGEEGELVFTNLTREGMPLIRYRSGDIASVIPEPCKCGRNHRRITRIKGRADDMLIIKGVNLFPMQIEKVLMQFPQVGDNYQIIVGTENYLDKLTIQVEVSPDLFDGDIRHLTQLQKKIARELRSEILVDGQIELVEPGTISPSEGKAVRVIDRRKNNEENV